LSMQPTLSQTLSKTVEKHIGIDYDRLERVDAVLGEYLEKDWMIGAVVLVVKDRKLVYHKGHGLADRNTKKPMRPDAIFRIMSQTKAITSLGILQLFEQGKLDLDQKISDFIPEFKNPTVIHGFNTADTTYTTVPAQREITFRDLLTHTSGIDYPLIGNDTMQAIYAKHNIPSGLGNFRESLLDKMKALGQLPLIHQPGERFTYGLNTDLLGCLIERISGETLEAYFDKHIFGPMGLE